MLVKNKLADDVAVFIRMAGRAKMALRKRQKLKGHYTCPCCSGRVDIYLIPPKHHMRVACQSCHMSIME